MYKGKAKLSIFAMAHIWKDRFDFTRQKTTSLNRKQKQGDNKTGGGRGWRFEL